MRILIYSDCIAVQSLQTVQHFVSADSSHLRDVLGALEIFYEKALYKFTLYLLTPVVYYSSVV